MVIDFHTHIFPETIALKTIELLEEKGGLKATTDGTLTGLLASMKDCNVDLSVIMPVATKPSQLESINQYACMVNEQYKGRLISFGGIHPDCLDYKKELKIIKNAGLKGIKIHPDYQGVMIDDIRYMNIIDYASELGLIILTHAGLDIGMPDPIHCPPNRMAKVLNSIQPEKMILAHLGGWQQWDAVEEYIIGKNVYLDTAFIFDFMDREQAKRMILAHGFDKILFATDSPWASALSGIEYIESLALSLVQKDAIYSVNARKLLDINE